MIDAVQVGAANVTINRNDHARLRDRQPAQAGMPLLLGGELQLEDDQPIPPDRLRVGSLAGDAHFPAERPVRVGGHQLPLVL